MLRGGGGGSLQTSSSQQPPTHHEVATEARSSLSRFHHVSNPIQRFQTPLPWAESAVACSSRAPQLDGVVQTT